MRTNLVQIILKIFHRIYSIIRGSLDFILRDWLLLLIMLIMILMVNLGKNNTNINWGYGDSSSKIEQEYHESLDYCDLPWNCRWME